MRTRAKMKYVACDRARREISASAEIFVLVKFRVQFFNDICEMHYEKEAAP